MSENDNKETANTESAETASPSVETPAAESAPQGLVNTLKTNRTAQIVVGGAVALVVFLTVMGGGGGDGKAQVKASVSVGQSVVLENPNGGNSQLTLAPGLVGASDAEEDKDQNVCLAKAGTKGTVQEEQVVGMLPFVKVKVTEGECQGKEGWTSKVNIKAG
ncbi:hypothetical protein [Methylomagnum sp.]